MNILNSVLETLNLWMLQVKKHIVINSYVKSNGIIKQSRKIIVCVLLIMSIIFTSTNVFAASDVMSNSIVKSTEFTVFVSKDGLYILNLKEGNSIMIDKGEQIKQPLISKEGLKVAYTKSDDLYIYNIKTNEIEEVAKAVESYDWDSKGDLVYSTKDAGLFIYNIDTQKSISIIRDSNYYNINCDNKNKIYANKRSEYSEGNSVYSKNLGIISYDLNDKIEKLILESKPSTDTELGSTPNISKISKDDRYIYIWNKPNSASMASDINEFAVYDIVNNKFIEFNNGDKNLDIDNPNNIYALAYKDNISQNPVNSSIVAINEGYGREMFSNKTLGTLNIETHAFTKLLPEGQVSMTPCYSEDGKNILYSGTKALESEDQNSTTPIFTIWQNQPHYIYEVNTETQKITQITNSKYFDFMPKYLSDNEILFVRAEGNSFSLWKIKDGAETKIADSLNFNSDASNYMNSWYYGHYKTEMVIDLFIK